MWGGGGKGEEEGGREVKGAYYAHGHTRCMGRHGSCRFVVFSFPSCLSSLWHYCGHMQTIVGKFSFILLVGWEQNKLYPVGLALEA